MHRACRLLACGMSGLREFSRSEGLTGFRAGRVSRLPPKQSLGGAPPAVGNLHYSRLGGHPPAAFARPSMPELFGPHCAVPTTFPLASVIFIDPPDCSN